MIHKKNLMIVNKTLVFFPCITSKIEVNPYEKKGFVALLYQLK